MTGAVATLGPKLLRNDVGDVLADGCPDLDCGFLSWMVLWEAIWEKKYFSGKGRGQEHVVYESHHKVVKSYGTSVVLDEEDLGREEEIIFYMSRAGTKVHFTGQCQGLNASDSRFLIKKSLCKYCQQKGRHGPMKKDR